MPYAAAPPRPGTVSITVSGPSTALAYARALAAKAKGWAGSVALHVTMAVKRLTRVPKAAANVALSALSTKLGYDAGVSVVGKAARLVGRMASKVIRTVGTVLRKTAAAVTTLVRHVAPTIADTADRVIETAASLADVAVTTVETAVAGVSQILGALVRSPLVALATTRAAGLASAALAIHALTKGAAASRIVRALPATMTLVVWATSPWKLLSAVGGVMVAAMGFAAYRLGRLPAPTPPDPAPRRPPLEEDLVDWDPRETTAQDEDLFAEFLDEVALDTAPATMGAQDEVSGVGPELSVALAEEAVLPGPFLNEALFSGGQPAIREVDAHRVVEPDPAIGSTSEHGVAAAAGDEPDRSTGVAAALAASLKVVIAVDGSIEVHGIPASLPADEQRRVAQIAADAAAEQLHRIVRRGRPIRSADRRHVTRAAQAAVLASVHHFAAAA